MISQFLPPLHSSSLCQLQCLLVLLLLLCTAAHPSLRVRERCLPFESSRTLHTSVIFLLLYQVGAGWADEGIKKEGRRLIAMDKNREEGKSQWWFEAPKDFLGGDVARKCVLDNMHTIMP